MPTSPTVIIYNDDVTLLDADVCVSTIHPTKNLERGLLSSCVLQKAGRKVQQELYSMPENLQNSHTVYTSPGNMTNFKELMFVCLQHWEKISQKDLCQVVVSGLNDAHKENFSSIAFPALGMGGLGFPPYEVAIGMLKAIAKFYSEQPDTTVNTIHIAALSSSDDVILHFVQSVIMFCEEVNDKLHEASIQGPVLALLESENLKVIKRFPAVRKKTFWENFASKFKRRTPVPRGELFRINIDSRTLILNKQLYDMSLSNAAFETRLKTIVAENNLGNILAKSTESIEL